MGSLAMYAQPTSGSNGRYGGSECDEAKAVRYGGGAEWEWSLNKRMATTEGVSNELEKGTTCIALY
jgi:hypothetical protein